MALSHQHLKDATEFLLENYPQYVNAEVMKEYALRWRRLSCKLDDRETWDVYLDRSTEYVCAMVSLV